MTLDTRVDPAFPRNAVHATFGIERLLFDAGDANRRSADIHGYLGLFGQSVLAVRGLSADVRSTRFRRTSRACSAARPTCAATTSAIQR